MNPILEKVLIAIIGVVVPALITWLGAQIVKYKKLVKKEEDEIVKKTIETSISTSLQPIQTDISTLKTDIQGMQSDIQNLQNFETNFSTRLNPM